MTAPLQSPEYAALIAAKEAHSAAIAEMEYYQRKFLRLALGVTMLDVDDARIAYRAAYAKTDKTGEAMEAAQAAFDAAYPAPANAKTALRTAAKQRELWLDRADAVLLHNVTGLDMGQVNKIEVFRDARNLPNVSYYGLFTGNLFEWFMSVQFTDNTADTVSRITFGAGVVGAPNDLNSFTVYSSDFNDILARNVSATLRNERLDKTV